MKFGAARRVVRGWLGCGWALEANSHSDPAVAPWLLEAWHSRDSVPSPATEETAANPDFLTFINRADEAHFRGAAFEPIFPHGSTKVGTYRRTRRCREPIPHETRSGAHIRHPGFCCPSADQWTPSSGIQAATLQHYRAFRSSPVQSADQKYELKHLTKYHKRSYPSGLLY